MDKDQEQRVRETMLYTLECWLVERRDRKSIVDDLIDNIRAAGI